MIPTPPFVGPGLKVSIVSERVVDNCMVLDCNLASADPSCITWMKTGKLENCDWLMYVLCFVGEIQV